MKNLANLVRKIPRKIGLGFLGVGLYALVSCATMTEAQETALLGQTLMILGAQDNSGQGELAVIGGSLLSNYGQMQHEIEVANAGKTQITINNNPPNNQNNYLNNQNEIKDNSTPVGFFMYKKWIDFDADDRAGKDEFLGFNESSYNLSNLSGLTFSFYGGGKSIYAGVINFKIWDMDDGKIINYFNETHDPFTIQSFICESKYFLKSGKYKAVLNTANKETFTLDFEIIK